MNIMSKALLAAAALLYLASWIRSSFQWAAGERRVLGVEITPDRLMWAALAFHTAFLFVHAAIEQRCPTSQSYEAVVFLGWCVALVYFSVDFSFSVPWLSRYVTPVIVLLFGVAFGGMLWLDPAAAGKSGWATKLHVVSLLLAYALFLMSFISGALYLMKEKALKAKRPEHRLPPLELLDQVNLWTLTFGFPLMTFGMFVGLMLARSNPEIGNWVADKKVIFVSVSWLLYAAVLHMRLAGSYRGRRVIILAVISFVFLLLALVGTQWHYFT